MSQSPVTKSRTCKRILTFGITGQGWVWNCDWPGVRARRNHDHDCTKVLGIDEVLPEGIGWQWREVLVSNDGFGCKVYLNVTTGERILAHNSAYGCPVTKSTIEQGV